MLKEDESNLSFVKIILSILLSPLLYFWYVISWPLGYFLARYRTTTEMTDRLEREGSEWFLMIIILFLWIFCSLVISFLFLIYSLIQYLTVRQDLTNGLKGLFGLAWIITFFSKLLNTSGN